MESSSAAEEVDVEFGSGTDEDRTRDSKPGKHPFPYPVMLVRISILAVSHNIIGGVTVAARRPARALRRATWYTHNFGDLSGRGEVPDSFSDALGGCRVPSRPLTALETRGFDAYLYCSSLGRVTSSQTT